MAIILKQFFVVECKCGEQLSGVPDCGFTVYSTKEEAIDAIKEAEWEIDDLMVVTCDVCLAEKGAKNAKS